MDIGINEIIFGLVMIVVMVGLTSSGKKNPGDEE